MIKFISDAAKSDAGLAGLLDEAREYAQIYLLAKQRHKGCEGTGELMTLKEEFRDVVDKVIKYCKEKKIVSDVISYDTDSIAHEIVKGQEPL